MVPQPQWDLRFLNEERDSKRNTPRSYSESVARHGLHPAPSSGKGPRGGPSCSARCGWRPLGEGRQGSLTPSFLHQPQMMKPCETF
ncbi:rCG46468 [Rattus norvegicus]|uniref:RCG46468 n=1 Tax=Rattus norvegicus TaxID=10116 RepID=A6ICH9_RAT|nr:rCG46468 [Rattus norvegicus]